MYGIARPLSAGRPVLTLRPRSLSISERLDGTARQRARTRVAAEFRYLTAAVKHFRMCGGGPQYGPRPLHRLLTKISLVATAIAAGWLMALRFMTHRLTMG